MERLRQVVLAMCATLLGTVAAAQTSVQRVLSRDAFLYGQYFQTSQDGCESMFVEVFASKSLTRYNDFSIFKPSVIGQINAYNACTQVFTFMSGIDEAPTIDVRANLASANVRATVNLWGDATATLLVDLSWSGLETTTDKTRTITTSPYTRTIFYTTGSLRNSTSITGTLVLNGVDLLAPSNPVLGRMTGLVFTSRLVTIDIVRTP